PDAPGEGHLDPSPDRRDDVGQRVEAPQSRVELPAAMVRYDDPRDPTVDREDRVLRGHDSLDDERQRADRLQPIDIVPGERWIQEIGDVLREGGTVLHLRHAIQAGRFQIRDSEPRRERERVSLVSLATAEDRRVGREAKGLVARFDRAVDELFRYGTVLVDVHLK